MRYMTRAVRYILPYQVRENVFFVNGCEICSFQYMKKLQFNPLNIKFVQMIDRMEHHFFRFVRKKEDDVNDDSDSKHTKPVHRMIKYIRRISAPDETCRFGIDRLKSQLYPDRFDPV